VANIWSIFIPYVLSVAFYMPTIALSNTVAFGTLTRSGLDFVKAFPPIRTLGTVGFIASMWLVNSVSFGLADNAQFTYMQLVLCGVLGVILGAYSFTLPECPLTKSDEKKSLAERLGLDAFVLFKSKTMAMFFIFSMLLGVSLQITNGYATSYINSFQSISSDWFASNPTMLVSISQISEALCILMTAFFLRRFGIKNVMLIAMFAWVLRFGLFGVGTTTTTIGVVALIASCLVYGVAFDFFNVSGAMFVQQEAPQSMQGSAQGLFMLMTNGIGASVGTYIAGKVVDHFCTWEGGYLVSRPEFAAEGWETTWFIFAGYALVVAVAFMLLFRYKHDPKRF
jgi:nucleoside transporter